MTRRPSPTRALHQLERHGRGTPNDEPPAPRSVFDTLNAMAAGARGFNTAQVSAGIRAWQESLRSKHAAQ